MRTQRKRTIIKRLIAEVESRTQGQGHNKNPRPRPRTAFPRTDTLEAKDQGQSAVLSKKRSSQNFFRRSPKKKKGPHKNFSGDLQKKNVFQKIFQALRIILTIQKIVLSSSRGQAKFSRTWGLEAKDFKMCPRGLHLWLIAVKVNRGIQVKFLPLAKMLGKNLKCILVKFKLFTTFGFQDTTVQD